MVRYLDNKVVTIKGERFTEIKNDPEAAAKDDKKTFVSLKPARQYRFHWPHCCIVVNKKEISSWQKPSIRFVKILTFKIAPSATFFFKEKKKRSSTISHSNGLDN